MARRSWRGLYAALFLVVSGAVHGGAVHGAEYHVDPAAAPHGPADGSPARPWPSPAAAFASGTIAGGDILHLAPGAYGRVMLSGRVFDRPVTLQAAPGGGVRFSRLGLENTRNIVVDGVGVWPDPDAPGGGPLVTESGRDNVLRNLDIRGHAAADGYRDWRAADWLAAPRNGVRLAGQRATLENSRLTAIHEGVAVLGDHARVSGNVIRGFGGDALRGVGDFGVFRNNVVADCVKIDDNHDDGFQSWSRGPDGRAGRGVVRGLVVEANTILEWTGSADHPLRCALQGIGLFDGMYEDLLIANNLIVVSAFHGIAVRGGQGVRIVHNTLISADGISRERPWIYVSDHKDGTRRTEDVVIANNLAPRFAFADGVKARTVRSGNHVMIYPARDLDTGAGLAAPLRSDSALRGTADPDHVTATDRTGRPRSPQGGFDPGAFETD